MIYILYCLLEVGTQRRLWFINVRKFFQDKDVEGLFEVRIEAIKRTKTFRVIGKRES